MDTGHDGELGIEVHGDRAGAIGDRNAGSLRGHLGCSSGLGPVRCFQRRAGPLGAGDPPGAVLSLLGRWSSHHAPHSAAAMVEAVRYRRMGGGPSV